MACSPGESATAPATGTVSISGFTTQRAADNYAADIECDQRRNTWLDPTRSHTTVADWGAAWFADPRTIDNYRSMLRCHILLRWSATPLNAITTLGVNKWISGLRQLGYANTTVATIIKVLSMILTDAADEGLIPTNPIRCYRRRGRRGHRIERERVWATPHRSPPHRRTGRRTRRDRRREAEKDAMAVRSYPFCTVQGLEINLLYGELREDEPLVARPVALRRRRLAADEIRGRSAGTERPEFQPRASRRCGLANEPALIQQPNGQLDVFAQAREFMLCGG